MFDELMAEVFVQIDQHLTPNSKPNTPGCRTKSLRSAAPPATCAAPSRRPQGCPRNNKTPRDNNKLAFRAPHPILRP